MSYYSGAYSYGGNRDKFDNIVHSELCIRSGASDDYEFDEYILDKLDIDDYKVFGDSNIYFECTYNCSNSYSGFDDSDSDNYDSDNYDSDSDSDSDSGDYQDYYDDDGCFNRKYEFYENGTKIYISAVASCYEGTPNCCGGYIRIKYTLSD